MKFPEASEEDKRKGWKLNIDFIKKITQAVYDYNEMELYEEEVETVLIAVQQVIEEQEAEACRQVHGFNSSKAKIENTSDGNPLWFAWHVEDPNTLGVTENDSQKAADQLLNEMISENPFSLGGK